jgi:serine/threonine protein kinase
MRTHVLTDLIMVYANSVRDIHPNNVLVTKRYFSNTFEEEYNCNLSDIGEGKSIDTTAEEGKYIFVHTIRRFGLWEYQSPEVPTIGYSKKSDMFAFGQLCVDMIRSNRHLLVNPATDKLRIPTLVMHIINVCLSHNYEDRYDASVVGRILEDVTSGLYEEGKTEFIEEDLLPQLSPERHQSSWDTITS